jgi:catechol 2,3-dioxygenase-like lactoylglutathione lyase family enzyme
MKRELLTATATLLLGITIGIGGSYLAVAGGHWRALFCNPRLTPPASVTESKAVRPHTAPKSNSEKMEEVTGIGGIFFKARDPARMAAWYRDHLGVPNKGGYADFLWRLHDQPDEVGHTAWALFPTDTDYFGSGTAPFMINYRVSDLDRMIEQLRAAGVTIDKVDDSDYGRFAWISDPEGNRIELWQPTAK